MNARIDFWCRRPDHLAAEMSPAEWRAASGQDGATGRACHVYDLDYGGLAADDLRLVAQTCPIDAVGKWSFVPGPCP